MSDARKCPFGDDCDLTAAYLAGYEKARADLLPRWSTDMEAAKKHNGRALIAWPSGRCSYVSSDLAGHLQRLKKISGRDPTYWMPLLDPPKGKE